MENKTESEEEKIERLTKIIEENPRDVNAYCSRGEALYYLERHKEAVLDFNEAIKLDSNNAEAYKNRGISFYSLTQYEEAIEDFNKAIELDPNNATAYINRGVVLDNLERYEEVVLDLNKAIEVDPNNTEAYINRGIFLANLKHYKEAILDFNEVIKLDPNNTSAYYKRGYALTNLKHYKEAILDFNEVIKLDPNNASAYFKRGYALANLVQYEEAILDFNEVIKLDPNNTDAILFIGNIFIFQAKWQEAAITFTNAKMDVLDVLTMFNEARQVKKVVSYMLDINKEDFFNKTINADGKKEQYKSIYIIVLKIIYLLHVKDKNEISFAHYTKRSTATLLLFENSKFRLNSIITANDPQEGKTLIEYLFNKKDLGKNEKETNRDKQNHDYQAFIGCFTFNHESLNQFRLYGKEADKEATGVSLVLKKNFFNEKMDIGLLSSCYLAEDKKEKVVIEGDKLQRYAMFRCIYIDPVTHKIVSLGHKEEYSFYREKKEIDKNEIDKYKKEIDTRQKTVEFYFNKLSTEIETDKDLDKNIICELLLPLRYLVKHVAFKEEQECRIFDIKDLQEEKFKQKEDREVKFTPDYAQMYIEYQPITDEHLEKVIFAPKARGIEIFKKAAEQKGLEVECEVSTHPFS